MPPRHADQPQVPTLRVTVNGADLSRELAADLIAATVHQDVDAPGMFTLRLVTWDMDQRRVTWADDERFAANSTVEICMGYVDQLTRLIVGEITGLEPEFAADDLPTLTVRGYDRRHRLLRGQRTRSFTEMKDSQIASKIAAERGLRASATDSKVTLPYVLQHNQTDMEFLQERARLIGYEVAIDGETLLFRPRQHAQAAALTLARDTDLIAFAPRLTTLNQVGDVRVQGWSPADKAAITAQARSVGATMGGRTSGPRATAAAFGQSSTVLVTRPVFSKAEADAIAQGRLDDIALAYIGGEGLCQGRADLRAGAVVAITGVGRRFSGHYYVTAARHTYTPEQGYRTAFTVRRTAT